jgi:hypothetical protein
MIKICIAKLGESYARRQTNRQNPYGAYLKNRYSNNPSISSMLGLLHFR